ncbi:hypothetical protein [Amycolatopsis sp. CA-230715]|uniref:hypothetical protein n=1 Tax=Amycolatopsis sp. CA-230715 TaxID=2745196 RepID=UPI001C32676D|nr:hypothetical protein [Amycolatopsis sp. CA-230715]QWF85530.1 hypothetical protein HUW46_08985 [Amycolatopsis sp. CA-230715]
MATSKVTGPAGLLAAVTLSVVALSACGTDSGAPAPSPVLSAESVQPSTSSAPPSSPPSSAKPTVPTSAAQPPKTSDAIPAEGACGTVTAASGLTLQVLDSHTSGVACPDAKRVVEEFHKKIAGKQAGGSNEPVSDTVDGWLCVSGPPAAQGGTTCTKQEQTVLARVLPVE